MIYPKFLKEKFTIGVPAPSGGAYDIQHINKYKNAKKNLENLGYNIKLSKNIFNSYMSRSASAIERAQEINEMFDNKDIDFIICAAGGEFLVEILPYVNFEKIIKNPIFVEGFSDPTGILYPLTTKYDIASIYGMNYSEYGMKEYDRNVKDNLKIISGNLIEQNNYDMYENVSGESITGLEGYNYTDKVEWKTIKSNYVEMKGRIIGGCIDVIQLISGTKYDGTLDFIEKYKTDGIIWYFDNCNLSLEELMNTLWKFNELGYFKYTNGFILGRNGNDNTTLGYTFEQALNDSVISKLDVPIIYDADISHKGPCLTIINGAIAEIKSKDGKGSIKFNLI